MGGSGGRITENSPLNPFPEETAWGKEDEGGRASNESSKDFELLEMEH